MKLQSSRPWNNFGFLTQCSPIFQFFFALWDFSKIPAVSPLTAAAAAVAAASRRTAVENQIQTYRVKKKTKNAPVLRTRPKTSSLLLAPAWRTVVPAKSVWLLALCCPNTASLSLLAGFWKKKLTLDTHNKKKKISFCEFFQESLMKLIAPPYFLYFVFKKRSFFSIEKLSW